MPHAAPSLATLRASIARLEQDGIRSPHSMFPLGLAAFDAWLGGGLARGSLHEIYSRRELDGAAAAGFGLGVASRAADARPIVWIRHEADAGGASLHGDGVAAFGSDPRHIILVRTRDPTRVLGAAEEVARCSAVGAALLEIRGEPHVLDLKASRRLALAAAGSGVTLVMLRVQASPEPSAATSRWSVAATVSTPFEAGAPGRPALAATLLRHRRGLASRTWHLEWDRDSFAFTEPGQLRPALPRPVVPVPARRPAGTTPSAAVTDVSAATHLPAPWRRAG